MRLILGGSFDPVHCGHLRPLLEIQQQLAHAFAVRPAEIPVHLIPCAQPVHRDPPLASAEQRAAMLELATAGQPGWHVDLRELERGGESWMVDTLRSLKNDTAETLALVLGADAFAGFMRWREPEAIIALAHLIVCGRPSAASMAIPEALAGKLRRTGNPVELQGSGGGLLWQAAVSQLQISSTTIRATIRAGLDVRFLVPDGVLGYIGQRGLYRD